MPATFAHGLIAKRAIDVLASKATNAFARMIGENNSFVVMGAAGPDYPYLTDILTTGVLKIGHTWANRMHYENTASFINNGISALSAMPLDEESFAIKLAWFCGYASHVIADAYVHPVINSIVGGQYMFTHKEHGTCELIQDIYIFKKLTGSDIVSANPMGDDFGYLKILDECSDPNDEDRIHPEIRLLWTDLLKVTHRNAGNYFEGINPDKWHYNYKGRVNFIVDPGPIFRHVCGMAGFSYKKAAALTPRERSQYIDNITLPDKKIATYDNIFDATVKQVVSAWLHIFDAIQNKDQSTIASSIKDWNLDTGVDESKIDLWTMEA